MKTRSNSAGTGGPSTVHEAELTSGSSGEVLYGRELSEDEAIQRRKAQENIVARGPDRKKNKALAQKIEAQVGPYVLHSPEEAAGPRALPHYQQEDREHAGHAFYETEHKKARKKR
jgi:hypothetical protein